jgi:hypothetical protein
VEGKVSNNGYFYLKYNTKNAFDNMMLFARCVILYRPGHAPRPGVTVGWMVGGDGFEPPTLSV